MTPVSHGKPCAGNPHARFEEGASAPETPRRNALLHKLEDVWMLLPGRKVGFGTIEVVGDTITAIKLAENREPKDAGRLVLPGLVNCHCHAPMTLLRVVGGCLPLKLCLE